MGKILLCKERNHHIRIKIVITVITLKTISLKGKLKRTLENQGFLKHNKMRRKGLEPSQDKLPLEPESSASAIPPSPLTNIIIPQITSFGKYFLKKI